MKEKVYCVLKKSGINECILPVTRHQQYAIFGGNKEEGQGAKQTICREVYEESQGRISLFVQPPSDERAVKNAVINASLFRKDNFTWIDTYKYKGVSYSFYCLELNPEELSSIIQPEIPDWVRIEMNKPSESNGYPGSFNETIGYDDAVTLESERIIQLPMPEYSGRSYSRNALLKLCERSPALHTQTPSEPSRKRKLSSASEQLSKKRR